MLKGVGNQGVANEEGAHDDRAGHSFFCHDVGDTNKHEKEPDAYERGGVVGCKGGGGIHLYGG